MAGDWTRSDIDFFDVMAATASLAGGEETHFVVLTLGYRL